MNPRKLEPETNKSRYLTQWRWMGILKTGLEAKATQTGT